MKRNLTIPFSTQTILNEAESFGITCERVPQTNIFCLSLNNKKKYFRDQIATNTNNVGFYACLDKLTAKVFFQENGISSAKAAFLSPDATPQEQRDAFHSLQKPVVVKPTHGAHGSSVFVGIHEKVDFLRAVQECLKFPQIDEYAGILIEEMFVGKEFRILATREKVIGITNRIPANVIGDGTSNIEQLIAIKNSDPRRGDGYEKALLKIKIDDALITFLAKHNLTLASVPAKDQQVFLRQTSNLSTGGDSVDMTDAAHESVKRIAVAAVQAIPGLEFAGIDFLTTDITQEQTAQSYIIVEINASPMLTMHDYPYIGKKRNAAKEFVLLLFPELKETT